MPDTPRPRPTIADLLAAHGPRPARYERDTPLARPDPRPGQVATPDSAYVPLRDDALAADEQAFGILAEALAERDRALLLDYTDWFAEASEFRPAIPATRLVADFLRERRGVGQTKEGGDARRAGD